MKDQVIKVSIIIVNYNLTENIKNLLKSILKQVHDITYEVIIVDNNSTDRSIEKLAQEFKDFIFIFSDTNYGFGSGNNVAFSRAQGEYLLLLNPDTYLIDNLPLKLYKIAKQNQDFGIIGPKLIYPDGTFQISSAKFPNFMQEIGNLSRLSIPMLKIINHFKYGVFKKSFYEVDYIFGSCMLINAELYKKINGFDENYFLFDEDADLCFRIWENTNHKVIYSLDVQIVHIKSQITGKNTSQRLILGYESRLKFFRKNYSFSKTTLLKITIICIFTFKYLISLLKNDKTKIIRNTYRKIIREFYKDFSLQIINK